MCVMIVTLGQSQSTFLGLGIPCEILDCLFHSNIERRISLDSANREMSFGAGFRRQKQTV